MAVREGEATNIASAWPNAVKEGSIGETRTSEHPSRLLLVTKALWVVTAALLPILSTWMLKFHEESVARRQGAGQEQEIIARRKAAEAEILASLLPQIAAGPLEQRQRGLRILGVLAPDSAVAISGEVLQIGSNDGGKVATEIHALTARSKAQKDFLQHVELGNQFASLELFGQATAEFRLAAKEIPDGFQPLIRKPSIEEGESAYQAKNFPAATRAFRDAFSSVIHGNF
jgi:hypothetical protein